MFVSQSETQITISWLAPFNGGMLINSYEVYWNGQDLNTFVMLAQVDSNTLVYKNSIVTPGTTY
jgi:hypothetical protein